MIYFIESGHAVKIGRVGSTRALRSRLAGLQTSNPGDITLLGAMDGDVIMEKALHLKFADYHLRGEWFSMHPDIAAFIEVYCYLPRLSGRGVIEECPICKVRPVASRYARFCDVCKELCSTCRKNPREPRQRHCLDCKALYERERYRRRGNQRTYTETQKRLNVLRASVRVFIQRGLMERQTHCDVPGCSGRPRIYHRDLDKPKEVSWLCLPHAEEQGLRGPNRPRVVSSECFLGNIRGES